MCGGWGVAVALQPDVYNRRSGISGREPPTPIEVSPHDAIRFTEHVELVEERSCELDIRKPAGSDETAIPNCGRLYVLSPAVVARNQLLQIRSPITRVPPTP